MSDQQNLDDSADTFNSPAQNLDPQSQTLAEEFFGEIPSSWTFVTLDDCVDKFLDYRGKTPPKADQGIPYISAANIKNGFLKPERKESFVSEETYEEWTNRGEPSKEDVIVTTEAPVGEVAIVRDNNLYCTARRLITLRAGDSIDSKYLKYALQYDRTQKEFDSFAAGTTVQSITQTNLRATVIPKPPLEEQRKIGEILYNIEEKILSNREINPLLEEIAKSVFVNSFVEFSEYDEFKETEKGTIPNSFEIENLPVLMDIVLGGTPDSDKDDYWGGQITWAKAKDVSQESDAFISNTEKTITELGLEESSAELVPEGTTVITARGTVGETALTPVEMATNQTCYGLVPKDPDEKYFLYFLVTTLIERLKSRTHGTVFDTINMNTLREQEILLPPKEDRIRFDEKVDPFMELIKNNHQETSNLLEMRGNLVTELISGRLRVNDITPEEKADMGEA